MVKLINSLSPQMCKILSMLPNFSYKKTCCLGLLYCYFVLFQDLPFDDGGTPNDEIVSQWLELIANTFEASNKECIAVHCVAGLGR